MDVNKPNTIRTAAFSIAATLALTIFTSMPSKAQDAASKSEGARVSVIQQTARGGRDGSPGASVRLEYSSMQAGSQRALRPSSKTSASATAKSGSDDFWFYTADVILFNDEDNDGYFHGIDLLFDADTVYDEVDVYAAVFLSLEGGEWNEYAVTDTFRIFGATSEDEYVIVTELETGYPTGSYDLLIELYDAIDGEFLTAIGPDETSELYYLPLEDYERDAAYTEEIIVLGHGGGNAFGLLVLVLLVAFMRRLSAGVRGRDA